MKTDPTAHDHDLSEVDAALANQVARLDHLATVLEAHDAIIATLIATGDSIMESLSGLDARLDRLEIVPGPAPFVADYHIAPDGSDTADGLTRATAWRSIAKAPADKVTALWDGPGAITGGAIYDRTVHLTTAPGVRATIKGPGQYSLRLQRANGSTIKPGDDGAITVIAAADAVEPTVNGEKPGTSRRSCVQLTDCNDLDIYGLTVVAGTDFGILVTNGLRNWVIADVSDAAHGFMLKGNLGTGADRSWFGGHAHDCNRMVRNTRASGDDYGAVGFVFENSTGGGLEIGWQAARCFAPSFDYGYDGGGLEGYDATDVIVRPGTITGCEGGFETGGSSGKGMHRWDVRGLKLRGSMTRTGKSPAVLIRNFANSRLDFDADVTAARVVLEVYRDGGQFGGSIDNSSITGRSVVRPGIPTMSLRDVPASTTVNVTEVPA